MRKYIIAIVILVIVAMPSLIEVAHAFPLPFGGLVTEMKPCDEGIALTVETFYGPRKLMWFWGELPYLMHIPPHIGQQLLGWILTAPAICTISGVVHDGGFPIIMHGSSI